MSLPSSDSLHARPLHPAQSSQSLAGASLATDSLSYASAHSLMHSFADPSSSSQGQTGGAPRPPFSREKSKRSDAVGEPGGKLVDLHRAALGDRANLPFASFSSFPSTSSVSSSDFGMATPYAPLPSFLPRSPARPFIPSSHSHGKENICSPVRSSSSRLPPFPRPESPLPTLPPSTSTSTSHHIRVPTKFSSSTSSVPAPLTSHTSLAAFKAANPRFINASEEDGGGEGSSDTHRTSSDVDFDFSVEYDGERQDVELSMLDSFVEEAYGGQTGGDNGNSEEGGGGDSTVLEVDYDDFSNEEQPVQRRDWVGIDLRPAEHDIPESLLVRSDSGKLVGARHGRAASAMDLRAQFKAQAVEAESKRADVAIEMGTAGEDEHEQQRREEVRAGKRPVEGERAASTSLWLHDDTAAAVLGFSQPPIKAAHRRSLLGRGFTYNPTDSIAQPPRSAPPECQSTFAVQQQHVLDDELEQAKRSKAFPLPLRLLADRTKRTANAIVSPALTFASTLSFGKASKGPSVAAESDAESVYPSPLFDEDVDGTVRTAPSTPNDTPLLRECFDEDETSLPPPVPVPHRLGNSHPAATSVPLAGLGFDLGDQGRPEEFPVIPLGGRDRQSRRISLPPEALAVRRRSLRLGAVVPSFSISPPLERPSEDSNGTTDSSSPSLGSIADPTTSPSRRLSRRLSNTLPPPVPLFPHSGRRKPSVHFSSSLPSSPPPASSSCAAEVETPGGSYTGPSVRTPAHLLITPTPPANGGRRLAPSFSFSPAPLRLVKTQLLRAAGYEVTDPSSSTPAPAPSPAPVERKEEEQEGAVSQLQPASPWASLSSSRRSSTGGGRRKRTPVWDDLADLWHSSPATWLDEVVPAKLAFLAGFLLGPWCWLLAGWFLRPLDGELPSSRGRRCRDPSCGCGRMLRGSALQDHSAESAAYSREKGRLLAASGGEGEGERWAGLDRWVFMNRVAAVGGGVGVAVVFSVAVWAAAVA
ncbi:hypothetical protein JCM8547_000903 [Rhodosporidiobolus lusitaniae]